MAFMAVGLPPGVPTKIKLLERDWSTRAMRPRYIVVASIAVTLLAGIGDYLTGIETTFTLLYMFPLALGTWFVGRGLGVVIAVLSIACATVTAVLTTPPPLHLAPLVWNQFATMVLMALVVGILTALHAYVERERAERQLVIEQLRHAERLNIIGKLATGVAHELGTPLNVISGSVEMMTSARFDRAKAESYSKTILEQTTKMSGIIRHLLELGRTSGSSRMPLDLNDVTAHAVNLFSNMATKQASRMIFKPSRTNVPVVANASEIEQVLSNLILNALQALPEGGTIGLRTFIDTRETTGATWRVFACVEVQDDGVGIDARDLSRVFDPFFTTKGVGEGTGLGLSVSYGIVQDHGGFIEVMSEKGRGARFSVLLPLAKGAPRPDDPEVSSR